jgi:hypothetical protein
MLQDKSRKPIVLGGLEFAVRQQLADGDAAFFVPPGDVHLFVRRGAMISE